MANSEFPPNQREFRCVHCTGKIMIPKDLPSTTGPCPHCGGVITSPAPDAVSPPARAFQIPAAPVASPEVHATAAIAAPPVAPIPEPEQPPVKTEIPPPRPVEPAAAPEIPQVIESSPGLLKLPPKTSATTNHLKKKNPPNEGKPRSGLIPVMLVLLVLILGAGGAIYFASKELGRQQEAKKLDLPVADPAATEANYIRIGWQKEAYQVLRNYMAATTSQGKLAYINNADALAARVEDFYGGGTIIDSDTPADAFSVYELSEEDRKRGMFMMIYDQPPQFDMKEFFRPLASLEVQYGVNEADILLSTLAKVENFAMEPLRVHAFFKRTPDGLKLDWEIFAQTKYRTFQNFVELPEIGQTSVFRVFVVEDVPEKGRAIAGSWTYRLVDPANITDAARVNVKIDSETGRTLSAINWRETKENHPITRTATVELKWSGKNAAPELEISRFICWEFLGLGGTEPPTTASGK